MNCSLSTPNSLVSPRGPKKARLLRKPHPNPQQCPRGRGGPGQKPTQIPFYLSLSLQLSLQTEKMVDRPSRLLRPGHEVSFLPLADLREGLLPKCKKVILLTETWCFQYQERPLLEATAMGQNSFQCVPHHQVCEKHPSFLPPALTLCTLSHTKQRVPVDW